MTDADLTLAAVERHGLQLVLLRPRSKRPMGDHRMVTADVSVIAGHLARGGNLGLDCGAVSGVAVLDFDALDAARQMLDALGPLPLMVTTGSGKPHSYVAHEDGLPAKIQWKGERVGEVQRGPNQHVVMPPSVHPDTGRPYVWTGDSLAALPSLPALWREHLLASRPSPGTPSPESWCGPPPTDLLSRALAQPGAVRRANGIKFRCPGCAAEGRDRSGDNAIVREDGRWGCAVDREHKRAIGEALGVVLRESLAVPGYDSRMLRRLGLGL